MAPWPPKRWCSSTASGCGDFEFRRKRAGHLISKSRFIAAQLLAYVETGVWQRNARCANDFAQRIGRAAGAALMHPVEANEVFMSLGEECKARLRAAGFGFYDWGRCPQRRGAIRGFVGPARAGCGCTLRGAARASVSRGAIDANWLRRRPAAQPLGASPAVQPRGPAARDDGPRKHGRPASRGRVIPQPVAVHPAPPATARAAPSSPAAARPESPAAGRRSCRSQSR